MSPRLPGGLRLAMQRAYFTRISSAMRGRISGQKSSLEKLNGKTFSGSGLPEQRNGQQHRGDDREGGDCQTREPGNQMVDSLGPERIQPARDEIAAGKPTRVRVVVDAGHDQAVDEHEDDLLGDLTGDERAA